MDRKHDTLCSSGRTCERSKRESKAFERLSRAFQTGTELNGVFRFVLFCFSFCFVVGGPGGGFGGPGVGFLLSGLSSGFATTLTTT